MRLIENLIGWLAPHECLGCRAEGALLCPGCVGRLEAVPARCYLCKRWSDDSRTCQPCRKRTSIHSLWAVASYDGVAKELLHSLKFERARAGAKTIAHLIAGRYTAPEDVLITYVPTASVRTRGRGYDQSALIAKELSRLLNQPCLPLLARVGSQRQLGQRREVRLRQMENAFRPLRVSIAPNKHVLLVDDVLTTGATCEAAARTLRQAGAKRVSAVVFAVA